ncbi:MAG TPA: KH domain-containing protein [Thermoanaerobaculia bacterium]|nr:KH domain-containing protein [Thermoanaerobaculia bacterium]
MAEVRSEVEELIRRLVDHPEQVKVAEFPSGDEILLEVEVAPDDLGKVIGRQGRTVRALRTLLETRNAREAVPYGLEIVED